MPRSPSVLTALGFSADVDDLYQRLRPQSGRDLPRVAASMLRTPEELLEELQVLLEVGVVRLEGQELHVATPTEVLRTMVAAQSVLADRAHRRLDGIVEAISRLAAEEDRPARGQLEHSAPLEGELATGGDIYGLVRSLILRGSGELLWLRPDQWRGPREDRMIALVAEAVAQGRRSRAIYPVRALHDAPDTLTGRVAAGEEVRVLPELPSRLLVIGASHALLPEPLGFADQPLAIVRQRGVVEALTQWFEQLWDLAAVPDLAAATAPVPDLRRFLLAQLTAGARDDQIARQLGISLRTVRRRVADLMSELGADSRFQAGVEAARRGWL